MNLRKYVKYRRAQLQYEANQLGQPNSIGTAYQAELRERLKRSFEVLIELENFLSWVDWGEPDYIEPLSPEEKAFWRKAKAKGVEVPKEIEQQL